MKATRSQRTAKAPKRILIVDDHPITRYGLTQLISHEPDLLVCGEAESAAQALAAINAARPDLVLADITMPGKSGLEFIKDLQAQHPGVAVLVMSMHDETIYAERVLRAGGRGYIMKNEGGGEIIGGDTPGLAGADLYKQEHVGGSVGSLHPAPFQRG